MIELDWTENWKLFNGDSLEVLKQLPDNILDCCVTSPPYYGLRDYGTGTWEGGDPNCPHYRTTKYSDKMITGQKAILDTHIGIVDAIYKDVCPLCGAKRIDQQIGLEETPEQYIDRLVKVFHEIKRCMKDTGTLWINIGDSYAAQRGGTYQPAESLAGGKHGKTEDGENVNRGRSGGYNPTRNAAAIGLKHKDMIGIPWMLAFALRADGWYLRQDIIWHKPNPMPESVKDRCVKAHEYIFLLSKSKSYYFDYEAIQEEATGYDGRKDIMLKGSPMYANDEYNVEGHPQTIATTPTPRWKFKNLGDKGQPTHSMHERRAEGLPDEVYPVRNKRDVWTVNVGGGYQDESKAHYATYPKKLIEPCILAGCPEGGLVLDPFNGTGTTGSVAIQWQRKYIGIDLSKDYIDMATRRLQKESDQFCFFDAV